MVMKGVAVKVGAELSGFWVCHPEQGTPSRRSEKVLNVLVKLRAVLRK